MILPEGRMVRLSRRPVRSSIYVHSNPAGAPVKAPRVTMPQRSSDVRSMLLTGGTRVGGDVARGLAQPVRLCYQQA
jgi:hypothetical protein